MTEKKNNGELAPVPNDENASYQVVARRYRPQGFDALIGQDHIAKALAGAITSGRIGHAYLFTGARGVGKTSSARILAKALNCVNGPTPTPCNECEICRGISTGDDIDVLEIDGASNRGIDEIRQLRQSAVVRPSRARYKIYIIDEVHMLTREAFNALLKILEEPPEHVKFIFCTTEPNKLPITILSRCQRFDFAGIDVRMIAQHLNYIAQNEGITVEEGVCEALARRANGSMRDAQSLLEQLLSFASEHITLTDVNRMLGTVDDQKIFDLLAAIKDNNPGGLFPILAKASAEGVDFGVLLEQMIGTFRDLLVISCGCTQEALIYSGPGRFDELKDLAGVLGTERILASMQIVSQTISRMRYSTQGQILTEMTLVRLCGLSRLTDAVRLIDRLRSGQIPSPTVADPLPSPQKKSPDLKEPRAAASRKTPSACPDAPAKPAVSTRLSVPVTEEMASKPQAVADALPPAPKPALATLTNDALMRMWREVAGRFGISLSCAAAAVTRVEWGSGKLRLGIPSGQAGDQPADICSKGSKTIAAAFGEFVSDAAVPVEIFRTEEEAASVSSRPRPASVSAASKREELRKKIQNPIVKKIESFFGGKLEEVSDS
ncbi:MAG: DNA polymerase III subunit gamma/tau [Thermoguttaceae bacterium]|nr:DNA polymerase III subunit gamma/tau [Thermoguttaceae bacterium]